ncbi:SufD family Fe-S cluster assembly protein [bacterium]|nr:SufD family Fe-S cluster assembly protein [bacterium]
MLPLLETNIIGKENKEYYKLVVDENNYSFSIFKNTDTKILILSEIKKDATITIDILENSKVELIFISYGSSNYDLNINVSRDSSLKLYTSDYYESDATINKTINLKGTNAYLYSYEYLPVLNNNITGKFSLNHLDKNTTSEAYLYYLSRGNGTIDRDAISTIEKDMTNSSSKEVIKGMLLSRCSKIFAKPVLIIKCDDVHAEHGCAIGTIDTNEIYYLMSRGLSYEDALKIISKSLINPIYKEIDNEEFLSTVKAMLDKTIG